MPNVGAIAANLGAYATLWQQEQIDIAPYNFNFVQTLKAQGRAGRASDSGYRRRSAGTPACIWSLTRPSPIWRSKYIDLHLDPGIQAQMLKPPYDVIPTNSKVKLEGAITTSIAKSQADLAKVRGFDWDKLNPQRGALIERFNREIKV